MNNDIKFISPFKRLCVTVGNLPTAYMESMSYYECLTYFMKFLENQVIPAINNNSEVVKELQDYVTHYFDNLDVQTEIDNKLDDMAESGQLADIINEEIFNTLNSQVETNTQDISDIKDDLNLKNNKKYLLIGDSYSTGYQGTGIEPIEGFFEKAVNNLDLTATILDANGYGFIGMSSGLTWKNLVINADLSDKDTYTDIIICGGMNDRSTDLGIQNAMEDTFNYLKTNFPNAMIHVGCIGRYATASEQNLVNMQRISKLYKVITINNGYKYIDGSELLLHNLSWYISDGIHPNSDGENQLAFGIEQYIQNGNIESFYNVNDLSGQNADTITPADANTDTSNLDLYSYMTKDLVNFYINGRIDFTTSIELDNLTSIKIGRLTSSYLCASKYKQGLNEFITGFVYNDTEINGSHFVKVSFILYNDNNNDLWLKAFTVMDNGNVLNDLSISEISFPYGAIKCSVSSYYC